MHLTPSATSRSPRTAANTASLTFLIKTVTNPKDNVINIRTVVGDPTTVLITGQQPDVTQIELVDRPPPWRRSRGAPWPAST